MAQGDVPITVVGHAVADAELKFTREGKPVGSFRVASTTRRYDRDKQAWVDGDTTFLTVTVWGQMAENVAETVTKGLRVIVTGRLKQRSYETREGEKRTVYEVEADEVGPSLRNASAKVSKASRGGGNGGYGGQQQAQAREADPWATGSDYTDEPPF